MTRAPCSLGVVLLTIVKVTSFTLKRLSLCQNFHFEKSFTLPRLSLWEVFHFEKSFTLRSLLFCEGSHEGLITHSTFNSISDLCTLPATSINSQYTLDGVGKADGTTLAVGTSVTMLCDQDWTFKNENKLVTQCTKGLATSDIKNECFSESWLICLCKLFALR